MRNEQHTYVRNDRVRFFKTFEHLFYTQDGLMTGRSKRGKIYTV